MSKNAFIMVLIFLKISDSTSDILFKKGINVMGLVAYYGISHFQGRHKVG